MRTRMTGLLAISALTMALGMGTQAPAADIYVLTNSVSGAGSASTDFGRIDTTNGAYTSIANLSGDIWNLAWNPTAGNFFATEGSAASASLRTLTTTGTLSASLGTIGFSIYGMAYRTSNSTLYAFQNSTDDTGTINTANGAWSALNTNPGVLASNPAGGRYSIMNDTIYMTVNNATPRFGTMGFTASSTFQSIASNSLFGSMVLANDGTTMYGIFGNGTAGQQQLYTIDVNTGVATAGPSITGTGLGTRFRGAAIVPEPSTYVLGGLATGVMAVIARRRKARLNG